MSHEKLHTYEYLPTYLSTYELEKRNIKNEIIIKNKVSIDERPEEINNKQRCGDWEIDTIIGKNNKGAI